MAHKPLNLGAAIMQPGRQASAAGNVVGALFYLLVIFAGVSSAISLISPIINGQILYVDGGIQAYFGKQP